MAASESRNTFIIGSRASDLALAQANYVCNLLQASFPTLSFHVRTQSTRGDEVLNKHLAELAKNEPGIFTKELEALLLTREYDFVVHSLKDVPTSLPSGLVLSAITERAEPEDALVVSTKHATKDASNGEYTFRYTDLKDLPEGSVVGTSSLRREAILRNQYPSLRITTVRGNLNTRLRKLDDPEGEYDALILATAGLRRLGWDDRITRVLDGASFPYGVSQGALGIECRADDTMAQLLVKATADPETTARCVAERAFLKSLEGGCQVPIGIVSTLSSTQTSSDTESLMSNHDLDLCATILATDGSERIDDKILSTLSMYKEQAKYTSLVVEFVNNMLETNVSDSTKESVQLNLSYTGLNVKSDLDAEFVSKAEEVGRQLAAQMIQAGAERLLGDLTQRRPITYGAMEQKLD